MSSLHTHACESFYGALHLSGSPGPPQPRTVRASPGTGAEGWEEWPERSLKRSQVFGGGMEAAEQEGRKKSVRQQWRAKSSSSRRKCGGRGKAL